MIYEYAADNNTTNYRFSFYFIVFIDLLYLLHLLYLSIYLFIHLFIYKLILHNLGNF